MLKLLKVLDDLKIADNTIVFYSTDNGPHFNTWPDAATTPFRSEKNSNWEGAYRVPAFIRWPGHFPAGTTLNGTAAHEDWLPTFAAIAGGPNIKKELHDGVTLEGQKYKNYVDGYNMLDYLTGKAFGVWREPFTELRVPLLFNLRRDPFEKSQHNSNTYND